MADLDFEMNLDRMFNEPPVFQDSAAFTKLVEMRLDRGWGLRQIGLGAAGLAAGLIGVFQLIGSRDLLATVAAASGREAESWGGDFSTLLNLGEVTRSLPMGSQALWMGAALAAMALAFVAARVVEELK